MTQPKSPFRYFNSSPEVIVTDGLKSYPAALTEIGAIGKQVNGRR